MENAGRATQGEELPGGCLRQVRLRINESLDLDATLQAVMDSARSLACAAYGVVTALGFPMLGMEGDSLQ